ncbi:hypothetical protein BDW72DRAFT_18051 [Aspergillus terricola var. indicus]
MADFIPSVGLTYFPGRNSTALCSTMSQTFRDLHTLCLLDAPSIHRPCVILRVFRHDLHTLHAAFAPGPVAGIPLVTGKKFEKMPRIIGCGGNCGSCRSPNLRGPCPIIVVGRALGASLGFHLSGFHPTRFQFPRFWQQFPSTDPQTVNADCSVKILLPNSLPWIELRSWQLP